MHSRAFHIPTALVLSLGVAGCATTSPPPTETAIETSNSPSPEPTDYLTLNYLSQQRVIDEPTPRVPSSPEYTPPPPTDLYSPKQVRTDTPDNNPYFWAILGRWFIVDKADPTRDNAFPCEITFTGHGFRAGTNELVRTRFRAWGANISCWSMRISKASQWALFDDDIYLFNSVGNSIGAVWRVSEDLWENDNYELRREVPD